LGHADDGFEAGRDFVVLLAGDLAGVGVDLGGELGSGPAGSGAQRLEAIAVEGASSARYFFAVRQSTPHSRAISA
jgi:hypothetical protein